MSTLLEITADMQALDDLISERDGDLSDPAIEAIICEWIKENTDSFDFKLDNYAALIKIMEGRAKIRREESKRLADRARVDENAAHGLKERLHYVFKFRQLRKVETSRFCVSIQKNGGSLPVDVDPTQIGKLPDDCQRITVEPDREAIRKRLEAGEELPGCKLGERGESLRIR